MGGTMRVLVAGAGVAGSVAAMALHKAGFEPVVFEAYERGAGLAHGVYLTVAVNGLDALRAVDAHHVVRAAGFLSEKIDFYSYRSAARPDPARPDAAGRYGHAHHPAGRPLRRP